MTDADQAAYTEMVLDSKTAGGIITPSYAFRVDDPDFQRMSADTQEHFRKAQVVGSVLGVLLLWYAYRVLTHAK